MQRTWVVLWAVLVVFVVAAGAGPRSPAARVLSVKGKAMIVEPENYDRPAATYGTIYSDEKLVVSKDSLVALVFRADGHIERIAKAGTFQVTQNGCQPTNGIERVAMSEAALATIGKVSKGSRGIVQGGVVMARSPAPSAEPVNTVAPEKMRPLPGTAVLVSKPEFSWPAVPRVKSYTLNLYFAGNRVWSTDTERPKVEYAGETPLKPGAMYSWDVIVKSSDRSLTICEGMFRTASDRQREEAAALQELMAKPDPLCLAVAAMWYKQNDFVGEAIAANEQLVKLAPDAEVYHELAQLLFMSGRDEEGNAAEAKANAMEKKVEAEK